MERKLQNHTLGQQYPVVSQSRMEIWWHAWYFEKYQDEEPQIVRINKVNRETVEVQWMQGLYSDTWHPCKIKKGRNYEPWLKEVPRSIILYQIELTSAMRLAQPLRKN